MSLCWGTCYPPEIKTNASVTTLRLHPGVIIATAFIHLLDPAISELGSPCLTGEWTVYPWALAIAMMSVFGIFILELVAYRVGVQWMDSLGIEVHDTHGPAVAHGPERPHNHAHGTGPHQHNHVRHGDESLLPNTPPNEKEKSAAGDLSPASSSSDVESASTLERYSSVAQIIGVAILEFGESLGHSLCHVARNPAYHPS